MRSKNGGKEFCFFALPGLFCFLAVVIVPFIYGVYLTLTDWDGVAAVKNFVGLENFAGVMKDSAFWDSLLLTFKYVILVVIIVNVIAFAIAFLLTRGDQGPEFLPGRILHPEPDWRYRSWIYLAVCIFTCIRQHRRGNRMETVRSILAVRSDQSIRGAGCSQCMAAVRLYDPDLCGRLHGTE